MRLQAAKWGNSTAVRFPKAVTDAMGIEPGTELEFILDGEGGGYLRAVRRKPITLEEICAEMRRLGPENEPETVDWGPDVGEEIIDDDYSRGLIKPPASW